jgi:hypothetical protein
MGGKKIVGHSSDEIRGRYYVCSELAIQARVSVSFHSLS